MKNINNKPIFFDSIVYKKNTHILEESQKLELAKLCVNTGLTVFIYDDIKVINQLNSIYNDKFSYIYNLNGQEKSLYFDINQHIF